MTEEKDVIGLENTVEGDTMNKRGRRRKYSSKEEAIEAYKKQQKEAQERYAQQRRTFAHNASTKQKQLCKWLQTHFIQDSQLVDEVIKKLEENCL